LFQTIRQRAERQEDIIFLLDNVQKKPCDEWFRELWNIRSSVYIIITTNIAFLHFDLPDAEELRVEEFDEALEFLNEIHDDDGEDLLKLCKQFGWNILGLRVARDYMLQNKITARAYLKSMRVSETVRKNQGDSSGHPALYHSIRACLEEVDPDKFLAIATTSFISNNMIPVFLLSNQLSASNPSENEARLDAIHAQLKSLVQITNENENRFFSYHSFTQYVIEDMIKENKSVKSDLQHLPCRLAGIFVRYISKDNRFSKSHFLQRNVCEHVEVFLREHAKVYLKELEDKQNDDPTNNESRKMIALITFARLSELLGFTYTQQQPLIRDELDHHFERATYLLHKLCGITEKDLQPVDESDNENLQEMFGITDEDRVMFGITNNDFAVAHQLSTKLTKKSSELSSSLIELVFWRTVNEQDLAMFPEEVKENETVREKIRSSEPLSRSDVEELVKHGVAYSVDRYRELFLPELYLSVIYSFGRNYFYRDRTTLKHPRVYYIDLLKRAYCLSRAISKKMNRGEAVLHEFMVQANGLLYLLVNHDCQDGTHKEEQVHAEDLNNAICYYQKLINEERRFFEMGMLKRTKDDTTSKLKCYQQIIKCYKILLKINEDRGRCIKDGAQTCEDLFELLTPYGAQNVDRTNEHLVQYSRHMNAIAEFYLSTNNEEYFPRATEIFTLSAEQAEKYDVTIKFYLEALVGLADVCSRIGKHQDSICHLKQCDSKESLRKLQRQNPPIQERICNIHRRNDVTSPRGHERGKNHAYLIFILDTFWLKTLPTFVKGP
jgi:tetratricopeptide (TPR) repeat protein